MSIPVMENIAKYEMTEKEAAAYKMAAVYEHLVNKMFPDYRHIYKIGKGDPRKSLTFKHAWKVITEHGHEMQPKDYRVYVMAQLKVFKAYLDKGAPVLIDPNCLSGSTAWGRFKMYEKKFEQIKQFQTVGDAGIEVNSQDRIVSELEKTKAYLFKKFHRHEKQDIIDALESRTLLRWVVMKNVSGYYPHLSPVVKDWLLEKNQTIAGHFGHALNVYGSGITPAAYDYFNREFSYEYGAGQGATEATDPGGFG